MNGGSTGNDSGAFGEDDLLPISALQHLLFCERQCALIHVERLWAENRLTLEGQHLHRRAHETREQQRGDLRIVRGLEIRSFRLGLVGKADVVEFHPDGTVFPVEFKRGRPKSHDADRVQLCAQAICLEEMLDRPVPQGALFYGRTRRRLDVIFEPVLRELTEHTAANLHDLIRSGITPPAVREKKCDRCSLLSLCLPDARPATDAASNYLNRSVRHALAFAAPASD